MGGKGDTAQEILVAHFILQTIVVPSPFSSFDLSLLPVDLPFM